MTDRITIQDLPELMAIQLSYLGNTPQAIADSLSRLGYAGRKSSPEFCPIANFIRNEFLDVMPFCHCNFAVTTEAIEVLVWDAKDDKPGMTDLYVSLPLHFRKFIGEFDSDISSKYRHLNMDWK